MYSTYALYICNLNVGMALNSNSWVEKIKQRRQVKISLWTAFPSKENKERECELKGKTLVIAVLTASACAACHLHAMVGCGAVIAHVKLRCSCKGWIEHLDSLA